MNEHHSSVMNAQHSSAKQTVLLTALIGAWASPLPGQSIDYAAVSVDARSRAPLVVIGTRIPVGSRHDLTGLEGTAWLLGQTLAAQANAALDLGAEVTDHISRSSTLFVLSARPSVWPVPWATLERTLFQTALDTAAFERERSLLSRQLLFQRGSPALDSRQRSVQLIASPSSPWARSTSGTPQSLEALTIVDARLLRHNEYSVASSVVAAVGVGDSSTSLPPRGTSSPGSGTAPPDGPAWTVGTQLNVAAEITGSWISVAYPVKGPLPHTILEFIKHIVCW